MHAIPANWEQYIVRDKTNLFWTRQLGTGAFGKVTSVSLRGKEKCTRHFALKSQVVEYLDDWKSEVAVMTLNNTRILPALAYGPGNDGKGKRNKYYILMPLADGDIKQVKKYKDRHLKGGRLQGLIFLHDILYALKGLHENCLVHRDIKPANIFLFCPHDTKKPCNAALADFGLICRLPREDCHTDTDTSPIQVCSQYDMAGSPRWMLPELRPLLDPNYDYDPEDILPRRLTSYWKQNDLYGTAWTVNYAMNQVSDDGELWTPRPDNGLDMNGLFTNLLRTIARTEKTNVAEAYIAVRDMLLIAGQKDLESPVIQLQDGCNKILQKLKSELPFLS